MILFTGGAYQGKLEQALQLFGLTEKDVFECGEQLSFEKRILNHVDQYFLKLCENNVSPVQFLEEHLEEFEDKIVIINDCSGGVVPLDPLLRRWREENGRAAVLLSKHAEEVYRVFCGISTKLK